MGARGRLLQPLQVIILPYPMLLPLPLLREKKTNFSFFLVVELFYAQIIFLNFSSGSPYKMGLLLADNGRQSAKKSNNSGLIFTFFLRKNHKIRVTCEQIQTLRTHWGTNCFVWMSLVKHTFVDQKAQSKKIVPKIDFEVNEYDFWPKSTSMNFFFASKGRAPFCATIKLL